MWVWIHSGAKCMLPPVGGLLFSLGLVVLIGCASDNSGDVSANVGGAAQSDNSATPTVAGRNDTDLGSESTGNMRDAGTITPPANRDSEVEPDGVLATSDDMGLADALDMAAMAEEVDANGEVLPDTNGASKSYKRGIAFGFESANDFEAISDGISWWYNWSPSYNEVVADVYENYGVDWVPMTWNGNNPDEIRAFLDRHPNIKYLLGFNEPNFQDQANLTPEYAASIWPQYEQIAAEYNLKLIGPAVNYCGGCVVVNGAPIANDYIVWLDMFLDEYRDQFGREPKMDFTALHWYDFGIEDQVNRIVERYGKPVWVTEFALWGHEDWNNAEFQQNWLLETLAFLEGNPMVYRYSWFTGRRPDFPRINLFGTDGELTPLGRAYIEAPFAD